MVHKNQFIVVVKNDGQILREDENNQVQLPFGSEYSLLLKNLSSKRAVVKIEIDGKSVTENGIVIAANSKFELKGFLEGFNVKSKFKFIQKTKEVVEHRGDKVEDGIIRVEVTYEKDLYPVFYKWNYDYDPWTYTGWKYKNVSENGYFYNSYCSTSYMNKQIGSSAQPKQEEGITVKGSEIKQNFITTYLNDLESASTVIILKLIGKTEKKEVNKPLFTTDKIHCTTCGKSCKSGCNYCSRCGTKLDKQGE
jgi:hypothetical protein